MYDSAAYDMGHDIYPSCATQGMVINAGINIHHVILFFELCHELHIRNENICETDKHCESL